MILRYNVLIMLCSSLCTSVHANRPPLRCGDFVVASSSECTAHAVTSVAVLHFCDVLTLLVYRVHIMQEDAACSRPDIYFDFALSFSLVISCRWSSLSGHVLCSTYLCVCVFVCVRVWYLVTDTLLRETCWHSAPAIHVQSVTLCYYCS